MTNLRERFSKLLDEICGIWGYCGCSKKDTTLHITIIMPSDGIIYVDQFVEWVMLADDVNPNIDTDRMRAIKLGIRKSFIKYMGAEFIEASHIRF